MSVAIVQQLSNSPARICTVNCFCAVLNLYLYLQQTYKTQRKKRSPYANKRNVSVSQAAQTIAHKIHMDAFYTVETTLETIRTIVQI